MEKEYKRQYREQTPETKAKISASMKGRKRSSIECQNISNGLKDYWKSVPSKDDDTDKL